MEEKRFVQLVRQQRHEYRRIMGHDPIKLLFADKKLETLFLDEAMALAGFEMQTQPQEVKREFEGMEIVSVMATYGGGFQWGFGI